MSMFTEYGLTLEEMQTMKRQTEEENFLQFGFTFAELKDRMTEDGLTEEDFTF